MYIRSKFNFLFSDIKIILDFVPNHTSNESYWFYMSERGDSHYRDYYVWNDGIICSTGCLDTGGRRPPNNWVRVLCWLCKIKQLSTCAVLVVQYNTTGYVCCAGCAI